MRLTLRNILAYLNDILEPDDKAEMSKKISDNEFATKLVHRIHDSTQRLRLGAPKLTGRGMGLDPNTVAEYLDYTLTADREPDFEKVCLESDVHLAEVASCYRVLTLVLGEPAEVDPALRRRMYEIGSGEKVGVDPAHVTKTDGSAPPPLQKAMPVASKPTVPDYLRETKKKSGLWRVAATLLFAALLGGGAVLAIGPEKVANFFGWGGGKNQLALQDKKPNVPPVPPMPPIDSVGPPAPITNGIGRSTDGVPPVEGGPAKTDGSTGPITDNATLPNTGSTIGRSTDKSNGDAATSIPSDTNSVVPPTPLIPVPPVPFDGGLKPIPPVVPGDTTDKSSTTGSETGKNSGTTPTDIPPVRPLPDLTKTPIDVSKPPVDPPKPAVDPAGNGGNAVGAAAGVFISEEDVLMKWNAKGFWERVGNRGAVSFGETLLVFPTYRPTINLNFGVSMQLAGESLVRLLAPDENGIPGLEIISGRVILTAAGKAGTKIKLAFSPQQIGFLTFGDGQSEAACEVRPYHPPGTDPEKTVSPRVVDVYANSGQIRWTMAKGNDGDLVQAPARIAAISSPVEGIEASRDIPKWVKAEQMSDIERRASKIFFKKLDQENSQQRLRELASDKNIENRALAIRCLALVGDFDDLVASLKDEDHRAMWAGYFDSITAAAARDSMFAQKIRITLEKQRGERAVELYRMLWGYSKVDLIEGGQAAKLIELLNDDDLDVRVVSFLNLKSLTGLTLLYRPEATSQQRRGIVQQWQQRLKDGNLLPKTPKAG